MEEQREQTTGQPFVFSPAVEKSFSRFSAPEMYMQVTSMMQSPIRVGTANWTTGSLPLTTIWYRDLPHVLQEHDTFHKSLFGIYAYFKPTFEFSFQVNSTKFHQGELRAWYDPGEQFTLETAMPQVPTWNNAAPTYGANGYVVKRVSRASISMQPNVSLDAGYSNPGKLLVPFEHPMNCLTTNSADPVDIMGRVRISVFNQLQVKTGGSTSIAVQVWVRLASVEPRYPMWPHEPVIPTMHLPPKDGVYRMEMANYNEYETIDAGDAEIDTSAPVDRPDTTFSGIKNNDPKPAPTGPSRPGFFSSLGDALGGAGGTIWNFFTGNWAGMTDSIPRGVKGLAGMVKSFLDKPCDPLVQTRNMIYPVSGLAHMKGVDTAYRLSADCMGGYTDVDRFRTSSAEDMKLRAIAKIKSWVRTGNWSSSQAEGEILYRIPVLPMFTDYSTVGGNISIDHTYLSYIASHFQYWRGGLSYRFDFKGTQFQTGRVMVSFVPNVDSQAGAQSFAQTTCCDTKQFDVHETREFTYDVPYFSSTPWKIHLDWALEPTDLVDDRFILGYVEVRVATPLAIMEGVSDNIDFNIFVGGGDDIDFAFPCRSPNIRSYSILPPPLLRRFNEWRCSHNEMRISAQKILARVEQEQCSLSQC